MATNGWWTPYLAVNDPLTMFIAMILSLESHSLWHFSSESGWGAGGDNDPKALFTQAAAQWFWNWPGQGYGVEAGFEGLSPQGLTNAVMNWLGESMGSLWKVRDNVFHPTTSDYVGLTPQGRLRRAIPAHKFNDELIGVASEVLSPSNEAWKTNGWSTWGNFGTVFQNGPNSVYEYDGFEIYLP